MTDEKLKEILYENYIGEARHRAKRAIKREMKIHWNQIEGGYYATRIQRMVRRRKARQEAQRNHWRIERNEHIRRRNRRRAAVACIERKRIAVLYRRYFAKQLRSTWQKLYDRDTGCEFYFNFETRTSQYSMPHLLARYGDVEHPCMWQCLDQGNGDVTYLHLKSGKVLPRKPDGIPLCQHCQMELATRECVQCRVVFCFYCYRSEQLVRDLVCCVCACVFRSRSDKESAVYCAWLHVASCRQQHFQPFEAYDRRVHSTANRSAVHTACHDWREVKMPRCDMCNSRQLLAAQDCLTCGKKYCRPCFRRIHNTPALLEGHIHTLL